MRCSSSLNANRLSIPRPVSIRAPASTGCVAALLQYRRGLTIQQLAAIGHSDGLRSRLYAELHVDVFDMRPDGLGADDHQARDVVRPESCAKKSEHLKLARRQP